MCVGKDMNITALVRAQPCVHTVVKEKGLAKKTWRAGSAASTSGCVKKLNGDSSSIACWECCCCCCC